MNKDEAEVILGKYSDVSFESFYHRYFQAKEIAKKTACTKKEIDDTKIVSIFKHIEHGNDGVLFRKSNNTDDLKISVWISTVKDKANLVQAFNTTQYNGIDSATLSTIARLSNNNANIIKLPKILLQHGIILIYEKPLKSLKLDGVVYKNEQGTPVIALSLRYKRLDTFWFTIMHELSHVLLHYDKLDEELIDDLDEDSTSLIEQEANALAKDTMIPRNIWRSSSARVNKDRDSVIALSNQLNISPAIIAGRIRFETKNYALLSDFVNAINVEELIFE